MAYTAGKALNFAKEYIKNQPFDRADISPQVLDLAAKFFWMYAPWRWTISPITAIQVVGGTPDYTFSKPADYLYLQQAWIADGEKIWALDIMPTLPAAPHLEGISSQIAYIAGTPDKLRLYPSPPAGGSRYLQGVYKIKHTEVTSTSDTLVFPDEWFPVYQDIVLFYAYQFADDQRAGGATVAANGAAQYSGQYGKVIATLEAMKRREDLLFQYPGLVQSKEQR